MKRKRRDLTPSELENLARFKFIWDNKKKALGLTQATAGVLCGWNGQSAFSQYLGGIVPLNVEAVLRLAKVLKIHPAEIMPNINELLPDGYGDAAAASYVDAEALALANLILSLPSDQRAALRQLTETLNDKVKEPAKKYYQTSVFP